MVEPPRKAHNAGLSGRLCPFGPSPVRSPAATEPRRKGVAMRRYVFVSLLALTVVAAGVLPGTVAPAVAANPNPEWYRPQNHVSSAGDVLAGLVNGRLR